MIKMTILDQLPLDIIHYRIFRFLDWNSRVEANLLLPSAERIRVPLTKDAGISLMIRKEHDKLRRMLNILNNPYSSADDRFTGILNVMLELRESRYLIQYSIKFRDMAFERCTSFADLESIEYTDTPLTDEKKKLLSDVCKGTLKNLEVFPYQREVKTTYDKWTPVNAGPHHVVENNPLYSSYYVFLDEFNY